MDFSSHDSEGNKRNQLSKEEWPIIKNVIPLLSCIDIPTNQWDRVEDFRPSPQVLQGEVETWVSVSSSYAPYVSICGEDQDTIMYFADLFATYNLVDTIISTVGNLKQLRGHCLRPMKNDPSLTERWLLYEVPLPVVVDGHSSIYCHMRLRFGEVAVYPTFKRKVCLFCDELCKQ